MSDNLMENLNSEQLEAVMHKNGPLLIVAGAGTGKTTVVTQKIAYMIEQKWAAPEEILALTFTEKAAAEMEERVDRLLPIGYLDLWISTFHGFAEKILKDYGLEIGLPDFKLLNEFEQWILVRKHLDKFELDYYRPAGNPTKFIKSLLKHFSRLKDEDISPEAYLEYAEGLRQDLDAELGGGKKIKNKRLKNKNTDKKADTEIGSLIEEQEISRINEVANAYHIYQQLMLDKNALDFGDLINYTLKLFRERPAVLEKFKKQFKYIIVDEFQDTNWAQYELVKLLVGKEENLIVVGDDDQSIYRFRGASMSNILQFEKDFPKAKQIALTNNYRNRQEILDLSYQFINLNNPNRLEYQLSQTKKKGKSKQLNKKLVAFHKTGAEIEVIEGQSLDDEIKKIIEKVADLKIADKTASWNDFAILVRSNDAAKDFIAYLESADLPFQFLASRGLYAKPVIISIVSYLKLLDDYHESRSLYQILSLPMFGFSHHELVNFNYWARRKAWSLYEVLRQAAALKFDIQLQGKINAVLSLIDKHTALVKDRAIGEIVIAFLHQSGYLKYLTAQDDRKVKEVTGHLNQFMKRIKSFESASEDKGVKAFLEELDMEIDSGEEGALPTDMESGPEAIKIMTVHGAKGLEFKYVFIANMVDKRFPTIERREPIAIPDALVKEILPQGDIHLEEERRLFYVAVTRAKQGLYLSWSPDYGGVRKKKPSRFLAECELISGGAKTVGTVIDLLAQPPQKKISDQSTSMYVLPNYFSYTQLAAFNNCPYQYRFAHVLKIPIRGKAVFSFGKTMHATLQQIFKETSESKNLNQTSLFADAEKKKTVISLEEILRIYEKSWIDDWYESKQQKEEYWKKGQEILKEFYRKHKDAWPENLMTEKGFNIKISDQDSVYTVKGTIDRIDEQGGKIKIVDYKTGKPKDKLTFEEKEQLLIYQIAVQELFRQEIGSLAFYYLENNSEFEFLGTDVELQKVKEKTIATINSIKKGEFNPRPSILCKFCDFSDICEHRQNH